MGASYSLSFPFLSAPRSLPLYFILFYGMSHKGESRSWVTPTPELGACVQRAIATHSLRACPELGTLHRAGDSHWQSSSPGVTRRVRQVLTVLPGRCSQPGSPFPPQAASGHDTSPKPCPFPCKPCQGSVPLLLPQPNPRQGHHLP